MNLREFFKKLRSPMGATILFLAAIVVLVLAVIRQPAFPDGDRYPHQVC